MTVAKSLLLFAVAALAEIGGAWLVWQGVREHRGWLWIGAGVVALGLLQSGQLAVGVPMVLVAGFVLYALAAPATRDVFRDAR